MSASSDYLLVLPSTVAHETNKVPINYNGYLGIILADYPGEKLIDHLIQQNFINKNNN